MPPDLKRPKPKQGSAIKNLLRFIFKRKRLSFLVVLVFLGLAGFYLLSEFRFNYIVVHHTGTREGNYETIKAYHRREHGWWDAGYHLILSNGSKDVPAGYLEATNRYRYLGYSLATRSTRYNIAGVHLCVVGNYDEEAPPEIIQKSLANAVRLLQERYHIPTENIRLHRDCNSTNCPGTYITCQEIENWLELWSDGLEPAIGKQQRMVIKQRINPGTDESQETSLNGVSPQ